MTCDVKPFAPNPQIKHGALQGPDKQLELTLKSYGPTLARLGMRLARNRDQADDLLQSALERALRTRPSLPGPYALFRWLARVMRNLFVDDCRRQRQRATLAQQLPSLLTSANVEAPVSHWRWVDSAQLEVALVHLDPRYRIVFERFASGLSQAQIAQELGIPSLTVGSRLFRARKRLRQLLLLEITPRVLLE